MLLVVVSLEKHSPVAASRILTAALRLEDGWQDVAAVRARSESAANHVHCNGLRLPRRRKLHMDMVVCPTALHLDRISLGYVSGQADEASRDY